MFKRIITLIICFVLSTFSGISRGQTIATSAKTSDCGPSGSNASRKVDEFGPISCDDELARLDGFSNMFQEEQERHVYIIVYGGRWSTRGETLARGNRIKRYLILRRAISPHSITVIKGGYREKLTIELWINKPGACPPMVTPSVDPENVRFSKGRVKELAYLCGG